MRYGCWGRVQELLDPPRLPAGPGLRADPKASPPRARLQAVSKQPRWGVGPGCRTEGEEMPPRR